MTVHKSIIHNLTAEKLLRAITGIGKVCASRSAVTTGCGAALGAAATGVGTAAVSAIASTSLAAAPVTVPLAVATGAVALIRSLFD